MPESTPPYEPKCPSYLNVLWGSAYYPYHCVIPAGHTGNHRSGEHLYEWENSADRSSAPSARTSAEEGCTGNCWAHAPADEMCDHCRSVYYRDSAGSDSPPSAPYQPTDSQCGCFCGCLCNRPKCCPCHEERL